MVFEKDEIVFCKKEFNRGVFSPITPVRKNMLYSVYRKCDDGVTFFGDFGLYYMIYDDFYKHFQRGKYLLIEKGVSYVFINYGR